MSCGGCCKAAENSEARVATPVPPPPASRPALLPSPISIDLEVAFRIHRELRAKTPRRYPKGKFRFDAPAGEYKVTYVSLNRYACFAEVFGHARLIPPDAAGRYLSQLLTSRPMRVLDLTDETVWTAFGLDGNINTHPDYSLTQPWSLAWHEWYSDIDGIRYPGRHAGSKINCCLFLDRCLDAIRFQRVGRLGDLPDLVARAAERYRLENLIDTS